MKGKTQISKWRVEHSSSTSHIDKMGSLTCEDKHNTENGE